MMDKFEYLGLVHRAHNWLTAMLHSGKLKTEPCAQCGEPKTEGHHFDYRFPEQVIWLCKPHHRKEHRVPRGFQFLGPLSGSRYGYAQQSASAFKYER